MSTYKITWKDFSLYDASEPFTVVEGRIVSVISRDFVGKDVMRLTFLLEIS